MKERQEIYKLKTEVLIRTNDPWPKNVITVHESNFRSCQILEKVKHLLRETQASSGYLLELIEFLETGEGGYLDIDEVPWNIVFKFE